ncbi:bifunctional metallophosphatase/5'-nucleotidase, partial [Bacillus pseudomycoides]|nr:bifunctional metallophosphatase/5'-nucleotidase [Bacillus pseudomycoides]
MHGTIYPKHYRNNEPAERGLAKLATRITNERNQHEQVIVIDNCDVIQGTTFTYY